MANTAQHMNARNDGDLMGRLIARAELMGLDNPSGFVQTNLVSLVIQPVADLNTSPKSIGDIHAYAYEVRENYIQNTPKPAGQDLAAVTDDHLEAAITAVKTALETPPA